MSGIHHILPRLGCSPFIFGDKWPIMQEVYCFQHNATQNSIDTMAFHCYLMVNYSSRLKSPNQSQILELITLYQQFYYTENFRNLTLNMTISRFYASVRSLSIYLKFAKQTAQSSRTCHYIKTPPRTKGISTH